MSSDREIHQQLLLKHRDWHLMETVIAREVLAFIHLFIHLFNKYLFNIYKIPRPILVASLASMNKINTSV